MIALCALFETFRLLISSHHLSMSLASSHPGGGIYNSTNGVQASELQTLLVDSATLSTATYDSCTCVIVKPHAVKSKTFGTLVGLFFFS
jgi:hypothetical protein